MAPSTLVLLAPYLCILGLFLAATQMWSPQGALTLGFLTTALVAVVDVRRARARAARGPESSDSPLEAPLDASWFDAGEPAERGNRPFDAISTRLELQQDDREAARSDDTETAFDGQIVSKNRDVITQARRLEKVAKRSGAPVLLTGPTGGGKTTMARVLHAAAAKLAGRTGPFVPVNCAQVQSDHGMSAMFGHKKGAFTGAVTDREGLMKQADGGTLFLDEVGDLPLEAQAKLLTGIESGQFLPMGADTMVSSDFRLVAATCLDLPAMVKKGLFRADLYGRIKPWLIRLPPITERLEDVPLTLQMELRLVSTRQGRDITMTDEAYAHYIAWGTSRAALWPDNFRGFAASVERLATLTDEDGVITLAIVEEEIACLLVEWEQEGHSDVLRGLVDAGTLRQMSHFDRHGLAEVVRVCRQSRSQADAARTLFGVEGVDSYTEPTRLRKYLDRYGLTYWQIVDRR